MLFIYNAGLLQRIFYMSRTLPEIAGIKAFDHNGLLEIAQQLNMPKYKVDQLETWIYQKHASSYDEMTNLSKKHREVLSKDYPLYSPSVLKKFVSLDGTRKYLVGFADGTVVETVGIPSNNRLTVCFSTQAGCSMGCAFCATGKGGFKRNLAPGEIFDQIAVVASDFGHNVTNAVAMGQGEPFLNYDAVLGAVRFMNSKNGAGIGARHITISTCGIVPAIAKLAKEHEQFTLAISLHSAVQNTRNKLMPNVRNYNLERLRASISSYSEATGRRPTFEYTMINGVNDTDDELDALIDFCHGMLCHVNLISLNKISETGYKPSKKLRIEYFCNCLNASGIETSIRNSKGSDIAGACGQLTQNNA